MIERSNVRVVGLDRAEYLVFLGNDYLKTLNVILNQVYSDLLLLPNVIDQNIITEEAVRKISFFMKT